MSAKNESFFSLREAKKRKEKILNDSRKFFRHFQKKYTSKIQARSYLREGVKKNLDFFGVMSPKL